MAGSLVLNVEILGEFKKLTSATKGAETSVSKMQKGIKKASKAIAVSLGAIGVAFGIAVVRQIGPAISAASDLEESLNAVSVAFGKDSKAIEEFGKTTATTLGLAQADFNGIATQFSSFAKTIAGEGGNVADVIKNLATRGADFASVYNLDVDVALTKLQSGLAGQSEPLRAFGVDVSAATVTAYALANGIGDGTSNLTEQEKVLARYGTIMEQTSMVQGDFANTSDGLANSQRILEATFTELQAEVGAKLLPVMLKLIEIVNENWDSIEKLILKTGDLVVWVLTSVIPMIDKLTGEGGFEGLAKGIAIVVAIMVVLNSGFAAFALTNPLLAGALIGIAAIAAGMAVVYARTKEASTALLEFQRIQKIEAVTRNPFSSPEQVAAETFRGILDVGKPEKVDLPSLKTPRGIAGQSITNSVTNNINVNVNRAKVDAQDLIDDINAKLRSQGGTSLLR